MNGSRTGWIGRLTIGFALLMVAFGPAAFAADPVTYSCVSTWKPYKVFSSTAGINVMRAKSSASCLGKFQNCLERSSWSGYQTVRCNAWADVNCTRYRLGGGYFCSSTEKLVSGCVKGTYDYHTKTTWVDGYTGATRVITSEPYRAFSCSKNV